jgi:hypothetical protein
MAGLVLPIQTHGSTQQASWSSSVHRCWNQVFRAFFSRSPNTIEFAISTDFNPVNKIPCVRMNWSGATVCRKRPTTEICDRMRLLGLAAAHCRQRQAADDKWLHDAAPVSPLVLHLTPCNLDKIIGVPNDAAVRRLPNVRFFRNLANARKRAKNHAVDANLLRSFCFAALRLCVKTSGPKSPVSIQKGTAHGDQNNPSRRPGAQEIGHTLAA